MKSVFYFCILILLLTCEINAQYPLAPEIWTVPKKIAVISNWAVRSESPSINFDRQKLYFHAGGPAVTEWSDTGWTVPYSLNNNINQNLARWPTISPNGNKLYFSWYVNGWDLYYSDWDSTINDWGPAINCGPGVNEPEWAEWQCSLPNDTTLIFIKTSDVNISHWDSKTKSWGQAGRWTTDYLWFTSDLGIYVSPDYKKVYLAGSRSDTTIDGRHYLNYDIIVAYKDTTNPMGYKPPQILNFCLYADTQYFAGNYTDRLEGFPSLTPDGKKMYFTATYDGQTTIYESDMLIDENGDTVTSIESNYKPETIPKELELYSAYPNPFNPSTIISWQSPVFGRIAIKIFDVLGKEVTTLLNGENPAGRYEIEFDASKYNLSSGIYICTLRTNGKLISNKMIYLK